MLIKDG